MTIDERLERLVERHEALSQNVELLVLENRKTAQEILKVETLVVQVVGGIGDLVKIVRSHEQRLSDLEQN